MPADPTAALIAIPLRSLRDGWTRLGSAVDDATRRLLAAAVAERVVAACTPCGEVVVVTGDEPVRSWAAGLGVGVMPDSGVGLDGAAEAVAAAARHRTWAVVHADLPLLDAAAVSAVVAAGRRGLGIAPSRDGGTNLIAGTGPFTFRYGPSSFQRHLAEAARRGLRPEVIVAGATAIEIDTVADLRLAASRAPWLQAPDSAGE